MRTSRTRTLGLFQCWSQSRSFCAGRICCASSELVVFASGTGWISATYCAKTLLLPLSFVVIAHALVFVRYQQRFDRNHLFENFAVTAQIDLDDEFLAAVDGGFGAGSTGRRRS